MNRTDDEQYEQKALLYAERHGIIDYAVTGGTMVYHESFPTENALYKATVDLNTMQESREQVTGKGDALS